MPVYEYRCEKGHSFDVLQGFEDAAIDTCAECGAPAQRVFHAPAVHFKGSGFYTTDYGRKKTGSGGGEDGGAKKDGDGKSEGKSGSESGSSEKKADAKPAAKSGDSG